MAGVLLKNCLVVFESSIRLAAYSLVLLEIFPKFVCVFISGACIFLHSASCLFPLP